VPPSIKDDQPHSVLERAPKPAYGEEDRQFGDQTMGKKGGISNHSSNYQLDENTIQDNIRKAYKLFHQLKKDLDRHDTWIAGIIQAQALAKGVSTKALWKQHQMAERAQNTARIV